MRFFWHAGARQSKRQREPETHIERDSDTEREKAMTHHNPQTQFSMKYEFIKRGAQKTGQSEEKIVVFNDFEGGGD